MNTPVFARCASSPRRRHRASRNVRMRIRCQSVTLEQVRTNFVLASKDTIKSVAVLARVRESSFRFDDHRARYHSLLLFLPPSPRDRTAVNTALATMMWFSRKRGMSNRPPADYERRDFVVAWSRAAVTANGVREFLRAEGTEPAGARD